MSPRKILYIVIAAAVLLAAIIAVSGPYGGSDQSDGSADVLSVQPASGKASMGAGAEAAYAAAEKSIRDSDLLSADIDGTSVTLYYTHPITDGFIADFFSREDSKYGLESAGISYSIPSSGSIRIEFPEIATPRRIARWLGIWMDDLREYSGK